MRRSKQLPLPRVCLQSLDRFKHLGALLRHRVRKEQGLQAGMQTYSFGLRQSMRMYIRHIYTYRPYKRHVTQTLHVMYMPHARWIIMNTLQGFHCKHHPLYVYITAAKTDLFFALYPFTRNVIVKPNNRSLLS